MTVKLLTAFAGDDMNYRFGEIVDLPEHIAMSQVEAGNAELVGPAVEPASEPAEDQRPVDKKKK